MFAAHLKNCSSVISLAQSPMLQVRQIIPPPWKCILKGATAAMVQRGSDETALVKKKRLECLLFFFLSSGGVNGPIL